jgi:hypothetical protein
MRGRRRRVLRAFGIGVALYTMYRLLAASWSWASDATDERQVLGELYKTLAAQAARLADLERRLAELPGTLVQAHAAHLIQMIQSAHQSLQTIRAAIPAQPLEAGAPLLLQRRELLHSLHVQVAALGQHIDDIAAITQQLLESHARVPALLQRLETLFDRLYARMQELRRDRVVLQEIYGAALLASVQDNDISAEKRMAQARGMFDALSQQAAVQTYEQVAAVAQRIEQQLGDADHLLEVLHQRVTYLRGALAMDVARMLGSLEGALSANFTWPSLLPTDGEAGVWRASGPADLSLDVSDKGMHLAAEMRVLQVALARGQAVADELAKPAPDLGSVREGLAELCTVATHLSTGDGQRAADRVPLIQGVVRLRRIAEAIAIVVAQQAHPVEADPPVAARQLQEQLDAGAVPSAQQAYTPTSATVTSADAANQQAYAAQSGTAPSVRPAHMMETDAVGDAGPTAAAITMAIQERQTIPMMGAVGPVEEEPDAMQ